MKEIFIDHSISTVLPVYSKYSKEYIKHIAEGIWLEGSKFERVVGYELFNQLKSLIRSIEELAANNPLTLPLTNITMIYGGNSTLPWVAERPHIVNRFMPSRLNATILFNLASYLHTDPVREFVLDYFYKVVLRKHRVKDELYKVVLPEHKVKLVECICDPMFLLYVNSVRDHVGSLYVGSLLNGIPEEALATFIYEYDFVSTSKYKWRKEKIETFTKKVDKGKIDEEELDHDFIYVLSYALVKVCNTLGIGVHDLYSKAFLDCFALPDSVTVPLDYLASPNSVIVPYLAILTFFNELKEKVRGKSVIRRLAEIISKEVKCELRVVDAKSYVNLLRDTMKDFFVFRLDYGSDTSLACVLCLSLLMPKCYLVVRNGVYTNFCLVMPSMDGMDERDIKLTARSLVALMCLSGFSYLSMRRKTKIVFRGGKEYDLEGIGRVKLPSSISIGLPSASDVQKSRDLLDKCLEEYWSKVVKPKVKRYGARKAFHMLTGWW